MVARRQTSRLGIDIIAVQANQSPFLGLQANLIKCIHAKSQFVKFTNRIRLDVYTNPKRLDFGDRFKHNTGHTNLMQGQGATQTADTAANNQYW